MIENVLSVALPFVSVLFGGWITYALNVRQRARTKREDVLYSAIGAVANARATHVQVTGGLPPLPHATPDEQRAHMRDLARTHQVRFVEAIGDARAALSKALPYAEGVRPFLEIPDPFDYQADEIIGILQAALGHSPSPALPPSESASGPARLP